MFEDLRTFGFLWQEGPDCGGPCAPYSQSERIELYRHKFDILRARGLVYPCTCSRQDVLRALQAPHAGEEEPLYPGTCRTAEQNPPSMSDLLAAGDRVNWRFRVPEGETISFVDKLKGPQEFRAGADFGDFVVWRHDDIPSYQLAVVVDDAAMRITEVVRGEDLLPSTARQLLLYRALGLAAPSFLHCPLMRDEHGNRLAKRHDALSLRALLAQGIPPDDITREWKLPELRGVPASR